LTKYIKKKQKGLGSCGALSGMWKTRMTPPSVQKCSPAMSVEAPPRPLFNGVARVGSGDLLCHR